MSWLDVKYFLEDGYDSVTDTISDGFGAVTDFIDENPKTSIAIGIIAGVATAGVAAPAIAASIGLTGALGTTAGGTVIAGLEGAALSSASLAAIGGGSIAVGGTGMAGGTCVVAAGGGVLAGGVTATGVITNSKISQNSKGNYSSKKTIDKYVSTIPYVPTKTKTETPPPRQFNDVFNEVLELTASDKNMIEQTKRSIAYEAWTRGSDVKSVLRETNSKAKASKKALDDLLAELAVKKLADKNKIPGRMLSFDDIFEENIKASQNFFDDYKRRNNHTF